MTCIYSIKREENISFANIIRWNKRLVLFFCSGTPDLNNPSTDDKTLFSVTISYARFNLIRTDDSSERATI